MTDLIQQFSDAALNGYSRRDALRQTGKIGLGAAIASIPFLTAKGAPGAVHER